MSSFLVFFIVGAILGIIIPIILRLFNVNKENISKYTIAILLILFLLHMLRVII